MSNLAAFSGGKTPSTSRGEYWGEEVLWVTSKDMKSKYITSSQLRLSVLGAEQMQVYQPNTLLLVTRSGILRHSLPVAILKECATVNQDLKAIVLYMPELAEYIYVCLKGMEAQLLLKYTKSGTTVENVNFDEFQRVLLPIAPSQEIDRITAATGNADQIISSIEDNKKALTEHVGAAKAKILDLAIRGQLVPQDPADEPASVLLERIGAEKEELIRKGKIKRDKKESVIFRGEDNSYYEKIGNKVEKIDDEIPFELPNGWTWCRFSEVIELFSGQDLTPDKYSDIPQGIPYITGASNLENGCVIVNRWTSSATTHATIGDLLLTVKGSGVGKMAICDIEDAHIARQIMALRCRNGIMQEYLRIVVSAFLTEITDQANGIIPGIRREVVLGTLFPLPPSSEQLKISAKANCIIAKLQMIEKSLS